MEDREVPLALVFGAIVVCLGVLVEIEVAEVLEGACSEENRKVQAKVGVW